MRTLSNSCRRKLWFNKLNYFSFNADGKTSKSGTLSTSQYQFCLAGSITLLNSSNLFRQIQFSFLVYLSVAVLLEQFANDVMTVPFLSSCETWRISLGFFYLKLYYYRTLWRSEETLISEAFSLIAVLHCSCGITGISTSFYVGWY